MIRLQGIEKINHLPDYLEYGQFNEENPWKSSCPVKKYNELNISNFHVTYSVK